MRQALAQQEYRAQQEYCGNGIPSLLSGMRVAFKELFANNHL
jgi:hypothetical protein